MTSPKQRARRREGAKLREEGEEEREFILLVSFLRAPSHLRVFALPPAGFRKSQRGFALLLTLVVLVLAATLAVAAARTVSARQRAVARESIELQRRWSGLSASRAVLPNAEAMLRAAEAKRKAAVGSLAFTLELNGEAMNLVIADESAKANVNALLRTGDATSARARLTDALLGSGMLARIRVTPMQTDDPNEPPIQTLAQVFTGASDAELIGPRGTGPGAWLTTFGDGRPNLRRADARSIALVGSALNGAEIARLVAARDKLLADGRDVSLASALGAAGIDNVARVPGQLSDRATCHSLRIFGQDRGGQWYDAAVLDTADPAKPLWRTIGWSRQ